MPYRPSIHNAPTPRPIRWWPAVLLIAIALVSILWVRSQPERPFQERNQNTIIIASFAVFLLIIWWTFFSRAPRKLRFSITLGLLAANLLLPALFRIRGVSGDLQPIVEFRWTTRTSLPTDRTNSVLQPIPLDTTAAAFPQFLGPDRNGVLPGPLLATNWNLHPPEIIWRIKVGPASSGFAIVGGIALTQEQRSDEECVVAYDLARGNQIWLHADKARYHTTIAGEGPRATPTIRGNRVFTLGGTGILNCLDLATGKPIWKRDVVSEKRASVPEWGCASSPLLVNDLVIVHGGINTHSLHAFRAADAAPVWSGGDFPPSYASPILATLAGVPQILTLNDRFVSSHDPATGATLWQRPWGNGNAVCASPVILPPNRVLFSSGYGVGSELLEIVPNEKGRLAPRLVWKSLRMKSKFAHMFTRDNCLFGLDDGIFACVDLKDGSQRWKEGRYGHGQGLLINDLYLLMAESGELILLRPTPDAPNELARFRVFNTRTWNPIALAGDRLLVRNDLEAACLKLKIHSSATP